MTAIPVPLDRLRWTLTDGLTLAGRELSRLRQEPGQIVAALLFPVVMVVLFGYVFGSAIQVPGGGDYRAYLMPGLFAMVTFTAVQGVMGRMAADASRGVMDRLRSMPMARLAVPFGHSGADSLIGVPLLGVMVVTGLLVGWRPQQGLLPAAEAFALIVLLRYALGWVGVYLGLAVKDEQVAEAMVPLGLPFTMLSNAFVPTDGMPAWLRFVAEWNPVSALTAAIRRLSGSPGALPGDAAWPLAHPVAAVLLWSAALLVIFVPLSLRAYARKGR
ncbi:ABC transporter permease [Nonomuraea sp. ATR24]|uniref:ABC transporter permease n=1 Tax=Nonomuraea sp. ATR24 TaxID=1676744 RepID=UPI0035C1B68C